MYTYIHMYIHIYLHIYIYMHKMGRGIHHGKVLHQRAPQRGRLPQALHDLAQQKGTQAFLLDGLGASPHGYGPS